MTAIANMTMYTMVILISAASSGVLIEVSQNYLEGASSTADDAVGQFLSSLNIVSVTGHVDGSSGNVTRLRMTVRCGIGCPQLDLGSMTVMMTSDGEVTYLTLEGNDTFSLRVLRDMSGKLDENIMEQGDLAILGFDVDLGPSGEITFIFIFHPAGSTPLHLKMPDVFRGELISVL